MDTIENDFESEVKKKFQLKTNENIMLYIFIKDNLQLFKQKTFKKFLKNVSEKRNAFQRNQQIQLLVKVYKDNKVNNLLSLQLNQCEKPTTDTIAQETTMDTIRKDSIDEMLEDLQFKLAQEQITQISESQKLQRKKSKAKSKDFTKYKRQFQLRSYSIQMTFILLTLIMTWLFSMVFSIFNEHSNDIRSEAST